MAAEKNPPDCQLTTEGPQFRQCGLCAAVLVHPDQDEGKAITLHAFWHNQLDRQIARAR